MSVADNTIREDVIASTVDILKTVLGPVGAREAGFQIADEFTRRRSKVNKAHSVTQATKDAIRADLLSKTKSFGKIQKEHKVGMSTVQRVASELRSQGLLD